MATFALPIDFDANRQALIAALALGTGLPASQFIMLQPELPNAPRPDVPYIGIMLTTPSMPYGQDWLDTSNPSASAEGMVGYAGVRTMSVSFDSFGATHEQAYGLMTLVQTALQAPPMQQSLEAANLAVYRIGAVADLSALINTAYEGRAQMDVTFGMTSRLVVDAGSIDSLQISGDVDIDTGQDIDVTITAARS